MQYEHGIIGGGCAGLQMLYALLRNPATCNDRIVIFEAERKIPNKSWCFWLKENHIYKDLVEKSWPELLFRAENEVIRQSILPYHYQYISSQRFYQFHHQLISTHENVSLIYAKPQNLKPTNYGFELTANDRIYQIKNVYDSRPQLQSGKEKPILQHFLGWHVASEKPVFDSTAPSVMDFDVPADGFIYLLPFGPKNALIELTYFTDTIYTPEHYRQILSNVMAERYGGQTYKITGEEFGQIPMSAFKSTGFGEAGQWLIGTAGGITKATTGYTFTRITKDCKNIVKAVAGDLPKDFERGTNGRFLFYDRLLLGILKKKPGMLQPIMYQLFKKQPFLRILRFLNEESTVWEEVKIFASLPWTPFLAELIRYYRK